MSYRSGGSAYSSSRLGSGGTSSYSSKYSGGSASARSSSVGASSYSASKYDTGSSYSSRYQSDSKTGSSYKSKYNTGSSALGKDSTDTYSSKYRRDSADTARAGDAYSSNRRTSVETGSSKYLDTKDADSYSSRYRRPSADRSSDSGAGSSYRRSSADPADGSSSRYGASDYSSKPPRGVSTDRAETKYGRYGSDADSFTSKYRRGSDTAAADTDTYSSRYRRGSDGKAADTDSYSSKYRRGSDTKTTDTDAYTSKYGRDTTDRYSSKYDTKTDAADSYTSKYRSASREPDTRTSRYDTKTSDTDAYSSKYRRGSEERPSSRYSDLKADTDYTSRYRSASREPDTKTSDSYSSRYRRDSADRTDSRLSAADSYSTRYGADSRLSNRSGEESHRRSSLEPDGRSGRTSPYTVLDDRLTGRSGRASPYLGDGLSTSHRRGSREGLSTDYHGRRRSSRDSSPFSREKDNASPYGRDRDTYKSRYSAEPDETSNIIAKYKGAKDDLTAEIDSMLKKNRRKAMADEMSAWQEKTMDLLTEKPKPKESRTRSGSRPGSRASDSDDSKRTKLVRKKPRASSETPYEPVPTTFKVKDDLGDEIDALIRQNRRKAMEDDLQYKLAAIEDTIAPTTATTKKPKRRSTSPRRRHVDFDDEEPVRRGRRTPMNDDLSDDIDALRRQQRRRELEEALKASDDALANVSRRLDGGRRISTPRAYEEGDEEPRAYARRRTGDDEETSYRRKARIGDDDEDTDFAALSRSRSVPKVDDGFDEIAAQREKRRKAIAEALKSSEEVFAETAKPAEGRRSASPTKKKTRRRTGASEDSAQGPARSASAASVPRRHAQRELPSEELTKEDLRGVADRLKRVQKTRPSESVDEPAFDYASQLKKTDAGKKDLPKSTIADDYSAKGDVAPPKPRAEVKLPEKRERTRLEQYEKYAAPESPRKSGDSKMRPSHEPSFDDESGLTKAQPRKYTREESPDAYASEDDVPRRTVDDSRIGSESYRKSSHDIEEPDNQPLRDDIYSSSDLLKRIQRARDAANVDEPPFDYAGGLKKSDSGKKEAPFSTATDDYSVNAAFALPKADVQFPERREKTEREQREDYPTLTSTRKTEDGAEATRQPYEPRNYTQDERSTRHRTPQTNTEDQTKSDSSPYRVPGYEKFPRSNGPRDEAYGPSALRTRDYRPSDAEGMEEPSYDYAKQLKRTDFGEPAGPFRTSTDDYSVNDTFALPKTDATLPQRGEKTRLEQYEAYPTPQSPKKRGDSAAKFPDDSKGYARDDDEGTESATRYESPHRDAANKFDSDSYKKPSYEKNESADEPTGLDKRSAAERGSRPYTYSSDEDETDRNYRSQLRRPDIGSKDSSYRRPADDYEYSEDDEPPPRRSMPKVDDGFDEIEALRQKRRKAIEDALRASEEVFDQTKETAEKKPSEGRRSASPAKRVKNADELSMAPQRSASQAAVPRKPVESPTSGTDRPSRIDSQRKPDGSKGAVPSESTKEDYRGAADRLKHVDAKARAAAADEPGEDYSRQLRRPEAGVKEAPSSTATDDYSVNAAFSLPKPPVEVHIPEKRERTQLQKYDKAPEAVVSKKPDEAKSAGDVSKKTESAVPAKAGGLVKEIGPDGKTRWVKAGQPAAEAKPHAEKAPHAPARSASQAAASRKAADASNKAEPAEARSASAAPKPTVAAKPQTASAKKPAEDQAEKQQPKSGSRIKGIDQDQRDRHGPSHLAYDSEIGPYAGKGEKAEPSAATANTDERKAPLKAKAAVPSTDEDAEYTFAPRGDQKLPAKAEDDMTPRKTRSGDVVGNEVADFSFKPRSTDTPKSRSASPVKKPGEMPSAARKEGDKAQSGVSAGRPDADEDADFMFKPRTLPKTEASQATVKPREGEKDVPSASKADNDAKVSSKSKEPDTPKSRSSSPVKKPGEMPSAARKESDKAQSGVSVGRPDADEDAEFTFKPQTGPKTEASQATVKPREGEKAVPSASKAETGKPKEPVTPKSRSASPVKKSAGATDYAPSMKSKDALKEPVSAKPAEPLVDRDADFTFKPQSARQADVPQTAVKPTDREKIAPGTTPSDKDASKRAGTPKSRSSSPVKKSTASAAELPSTGPKDVISAQPGKELQDEDAEFTFKPSTTDAKKAPPETATKPREAGTSPLAVGSAKPADQKAELSAQSKSADKELPKATTKPAASEMPQAQAVNLKKVEDKPKESKPPTEADVYSRMKKPPIEVNIPEKRGRTQLEKYDKAPSEEPRSKTDKASEPAKHARDQSADAAPKKASGLVKEIGPDGKVKWVKAGAPSAKDAQQETKPTGQPSPRSASAAASSRRKPSDEDEELEPELIHDPNKSAAPAKHDVRFVPPGEKGKQESQVGVVGAAKPKPGSPQKAAEDEDETAPPKAGQRIKGIDQDQRDHHGPSHLAYDSEIGPYAGRDKKGEPEGKQPTRDSSEKPLKVTPLKPTADEDADFTFAPKSDGKKVPPTTAPKPKDGGTVQQSGMKPGAATGDEDADFTFKPNAAKAPKSRSSSPAKKPAAATKQPFMTPQIVVDEPDEEPKTDYIMDLRKPTPQKPISAKPQAKQSSAKPVTPLDEDEELEPECLDDGTRPERKHDVSFKPKSTEKPKGADAQTAPVKAKPGEPVADEDADYTFKPKPSDKAKQDTQPTKPAGKKHGDSDEELEPDLVEVPNDKQKPQHDVKFEPAGAQKPSDDTSAPLKAKPGVPVADEDADFTFKPQPVDKKAAPATAPKPSSAAAPAEGPKAPLKTKPGEVVPDQDTVKPKPGEKAKQRSPSPTKKPSEASKLPSTAPTKAKPGEAVADEDTDFTFKPKPTDQAKPRSPSPSKKPSDAAKQPLKAQPGEVVPDENADLTFKPKTAEKPTPRSTSPEKKPSEAATPSLKAKPGEVVPDEDADLTFKPKTAEKPKPRSPSPAKKPSEAAKQPSKVLTKKPLDSDEELEPELLDGGPSVKKPDHDVKFKPAGEKKPSEAEPKKPGGLVKEVGPDGKVHWVKPTPEPKQEPQAVAAKPNKPDEAPKGAPTKAEPGEAVPDEDADFTFKPKAPAAKPRDTSTEPKATPKTAQQPAPNAAAKKPTSQALPTPAGKPKPSDKKPVGDDEELEPDMVDGPAGSKPPHDVKFKPTEAKKPLDDSKTPPKAAAKPSAKPTDASKDVPTPLKGKPGGAAPDEDAEYTFKPKLAEKAKPRSPSPSKKPAVADKQPPAAPLKAKPGEAVPDEDAEYIFKPKPAEKAKPRSPSPAKKPTIATAPKKPTGDDEEMEPELIGGPSDKKPHDVKFKPADAKKPAADTKAPVKPEEAEPKKTGGLVKEIGPDGKVRWVKPTPEPKNAAPALAKPAGVAEPKAPVKTTPGEAVPDEDADFTFKPKAPPAKPRDSSAGPKTAPKPAAASKEPVKAPVKLQPGEPTADEDADVTLPLKPATAKPAAAPSKPADAAKPRDASSEPKTAPKPAAKPADGGNAKEPAKQLKLKPGEPDADQDADVTLPLKPAGTKPTAASKPADAAKAPPKAPDSKTAPATKASEKPKEPAKVPATKPRDASADPKAAPKPQPKAASGTVPAAKPRDASAEPKTAPKPAAKPAASTTPAAKPVDTAAQPKGAPTTAPKPAAAAKPAANAAPGAKPKDPSTDAKAAPKPAASATPAAKPSDVAAQPKEAPTPASKPAAAAKPAANAAPGAKPRDPSTDAKAAPKPAAKAVAAPKETANVPAKAPVKLAPGEPSTDQTADATLPLKPAAAKPKDAEKPVAAVAPKPAPKPSDKPSAAAKAPPKPTDADKPKKDEERPSVLDKLPEKGKKTELEKYVPYKPPEEKPSVLDALPEKGKKTPLEQYVPYTAPEEANPKAADKPKYDPLKYLPEKKPDAGPKKTGALIKEIGPDGKVKWVKPPPEPKPEPPPKKAPPRKVTVLPEEPAEDVDADATLPLGKKDGKKPADKEKDKAKPEEKEEPKKGIKRKPEDEKVTAGDEEPEEGDEDVADEDEEPSDEDMEVDGAKPKKGKKKGKKPKKKGEGDEDESDEDEESDENADEDGPKKKRPKKKSKKGKKPRKDGDESEESSDEDEDKPKRKKKKKKPADEEGSDDEDRPSKRRKKRKLKKKAPKKKEKKEKPPKEPPPKRRWVPPPRVIEEVVAPPPDEKRLCDILREEKINPIKHYAKKPNHLETAIPFVIPWEQSAALITQEGMGAFGTRRHNAIHIDDGHVELKQGALKSENVLPMWEEHYRHSETQSGMTSFGAHKSNVGNVVDHHKYESDIKLNLCESVIPRHALGSLATQQDMTPIGALRAQKTNVKYKENMTEGFDKKSNAFLSRQMQPNSTEHAGSHIMDRRRGIVPAVNGKELQLTHERVSDGIIPLLFTNEFIDKRSGADFGAFRPTVHESEGGWSMSFDDEIRCKATIPFQTAPALR